MSNPTDAPNDPIMTQSPNHPITQSPNDSRFPSPWSWALVHLPPIRIRIRSNFQTYQNRILVPTPPVLPSYYLYLIILPSYRLTVVPSCVFASWPRIGQIISRPSYRLPDPNFPSVPSCPLVPASQTHREPVVLVVWTYAAQRLPGPRHHRIIRILPGIPTKSRTSCKTHTTPAATTTRNKTSQRQDSSSPRGMPADWRTTCHGHPSPVHGQRSHS